MGVIEKDPTACAHCGGSGDTDKACCVKRVGIKPSNWMCNPYVVCCACLGSGRSAKYWYDEF